MMSSIDIKKPFHIISDSSCDLPPELTAEKNVTVVPFYVSFDEEHYDKELDELKIGDFYKRMVDNPKVYPKTSMPSVQDYIDVFEPYAKEGQPVICICISTKFSGSWQSAMNAREMVLEDYPQAQIAVIDATVNTVLQGLFVLEAVKLRDSGASYEETIARLEEIKGTGRIFFTVGDMEYLKHGGRIGKVAGLAGSVLGIRPVIVLKEGEIFPAGIGRSRKSTVAKSIDLLLHYLEEEGGGLERFELTMGYGYDYEEAVAIKNQTLQILREKGYEIEDFPLFRIGATISVHTGPYALGFGIIEKAIH